MGRSVRGRGPRGVVGFRRRRGGSTPAAGRARGSGRGAGRHRRVHRARAAADGGRISELSRSTIPLPSSSRRSRLCCCSPGWPGPSRSSPALRSRPAPPSAESANRARRQRRAIRACRSRRSLRSAAALLAALTLWQIGDRRWEGAALVVAIMVLGFAAVLAVAAAPLAGPPGLAPMPGPAAILTGLQARPRSHAGRVRVALGRHARRFARELHLLAAGDATRARRGRRSRYGAVQRDPVRLLSDLARAADRRQPLRVGSHSGLGDAVCLGAAADHRRRRSRVWPPSPRSLRTRSARALATWRPGFAWLVVFLLVAGLSISVLVDVRLMALRRWSLVFLRSFLIAVLRLPFLLWVPDTGAALYVYVVAWAASRSRASLSCAPGAAAIGSGCARSPRRKARGSVRGRELPRSARGPGTVLRRAVCGAGAGHRGRERELLSLLGPDVGRLHQCPDGRSGSPGRRRSRRRRSPAPGRVALGAGLAVAASATVLSLGLGPLLASLYGPSYARSPPFFRSWSRARSHSP